MADPQRNQGYSRKDIQEIFSPGTPFTERSGTWGISGVIRVPETPRDWVFIVTYGAKQSGHEFEDSVTPTGLVN